LIRIASTAAAAIVLMLWTLSCGGKPEGRLSVSRPVADDTGKVAGSGTTAPSTSGSTHSIRIFPEIAGAGTRLHLSVPGLDIGDGRIEWTVNGDLVTGQQEESFPTEGLRKGATVQARVKVGELDLLSNAVTLANSPPEIRSVRIVPEVIRPGDPIGVEVEATDRDGDEVTLDYRWEKNGRFAGNGSRMEGSLKRNDSISVRITPFDGDAHGNFLVVRRQVRNYPPVIEGVFDARLEEGSYTGKVVADDGDDDPLSFALAESPAGMTIDPGTGTVRWTVPDDFTGTAPVAVTVNDGYGGEAAYRFSLTIREENPKGLPKPASK